jgi:phosphoglycolate phosphatase-like HAD superfamily hydrolase
MRAAKAGGLLAIGALWSSSFSAADLVRAGADVIVEEPMEILDCIERMDRHGLN